MKAINATRGKVPNLKLRPIKDVEEDFRKSKELMDKYKGKTKKDFLVPVERLVKLVKGDTREITTTDDPMHAVIGQPMRSYHAGYESSLEIVLENSPVKIITFNGLPPIFKGDMIRAYVVKAKACNYFIDPMDMLDDGQRTLYLPRDDFREIEPAAKIEKLVDGKVIATYLNDPEKIELEYDQHIII